MRPDETEQEVEQLLAPAARARLPLRRQLILYLNPFALFKDAARGPARMREHALSYNRAMRWMLLPYVRRWFMIACRAMRPVTRVRFRLKAVSSARSQAMLIRRGIPREWA